MTPDSVRQAKEVLVKLIEDLVFEPERDALTTALTIINEWEKQTHSAQYRRVEILTAELARLQGIDKYLQEELARYKNALIEITMIDIADNRARDIAKQSLAGEKEII